MAAFRLSTEYLGSNKNKETSTDGRRWMTGNINSAHHYNNVKSRTKNNFVAQLCGSTKFQFSIAKQTWLLVTQTTT